MKSTLSLALVAIMLASASNAFVILPQDMMLPNPTDVRAKICNVQDPPRGCFTKR